MNPDDTCPRRVARLLRLKDIELQTDIAGLGVFDIGFGDDIVGQFRRLLGESCGPKQQYERNSGKLAHENSPRIERRMERLYCRGEIARCNKRAVNWDRIWSRLKTSKLDEAFLH